MDCRLLSFEFNNYVLYHSVSPNYQDHEALTDLHPFEAALFSAPSFLFVVSQFHLVHRLAPKSILCYFLNYFLFI